jgi:hypothetical protein
LEAEGVVTEDVVTEDSPLLQTKFIFFWSRGFIFFKRGISSIEADMLLPKKINHLLQMH